MKNTKKNTVAAICIICVALLCLAVGILLNFLGSQIPSNPAGTVGNSAGNINNAGLFCEHDGMVYFSNTYDNGGLYSMDLAEGSLHKINDVPVSNILAGGNYLYYFRSGASGEAGLGSIRSVNSFNRCKLDGSNTVSLTRSVIIKAQLVNDSLYYLTIGDATTEFYKMNTDKSDLTLLADYEINPACAVNGSIYYNGTQTDHYLYKLDTTTDVPSEVWQGNIWYPCIQGDYVYYLDVAENYRLCRYSLSQNIVEVLTNDRVDCFNVGNGYIYYQANSDTPGLKCMREDGSNVQMIAEGYYTDINMTSQYVYFWEFGDETTMYHSPLGSSSYGEFTAAKEAALNK